MEVMRVSPIMTAAGGALVGVALPWLEFGGPPVNPQSMLRSAEFKGLMESIQSRSASSILGTVESAPMETLTKEAKSSKSSLEVVISSISSLVRLTGELEVTSLFCEAAEPAELLELVVDTTLLPLEGFCKLIDKVVVELIEPFELGELRFKSVIDLLLLLDDRTGSIVKLDPIETVVRAVLG